MTLVDLTHESFRFTVVSRKDMAALTENRQVPVIPLVQAVKRAKPHAAICGRQNRPDNCVGQPLLHRNGGDVEFPKTIEAIKRRSPNVAFTILEETRNVIA